MRDNCRMDLPTKVVIMEITAQQYDAAKRSKYAKFHFVFEEHGCKLEKPRIYLHCGNY